MMTKRYIKNALMGVGVTALWMLLCGVMMVTWLGHPAEQPVDGVAYIETIGGEF